MNNARRKELQAVADKLEDLKTELERIKGDEQDGFDNLPESLQSGESGQKMEAAIDQIDEAFNALDEALGAIQTATE